MGLLDRVLGRPPKDKKEAAPVEEASPLQTPSPSPTSAPELIQDASSTYGPPSLNQATLGGGIAAAGLPNLSMPTSSGRLHDPFEGLSSAVVGKKHAFRLPERPEFVFEEEVAVRKRGWTENLQFYTGVGYLAGGATGVAAGAYTYVTVKPEIPLDNWKLKANRILNAAGSHAKPFGNGAGILGLYFASIESYLANVVDLPGIPDAANTIAAGALSGALFRAPRGPRQAAAAAVVGVAGGAGIAALRTVFPSL